MFRDKKSWLFFFFFKQKTAYEIRLSLVGSEMCIRDRWGSGAENHLPAAPPRPGLHTDEASALDRAEALLLKLEDAPGQSSSRMNQMRTSNLATRHHSGK